MSFSKIIFLLQFVQLQGHAESVFAPNSLVEARAHLHKSEFAKAEELFRATYAKKESRREAALGLAAALEGQEKFEEGIAVLREALESSPTDLSLILKVSDLLLVTGQAPLARAELDRVRVLRPGHPELEERDGMIKAAMGQTAEAIEILEGLRARARLSERGYLPLARLQADAGNLASAEKILREHEASYAPSTKVHLLLALALAGQKKNAEAEVYHRRAIQLSPRSPEVWFAYGEFLQQKGRAVESQDVLEKGLALDPRNSELQLRLAELLEKGGKDQEAMDAYIRALTRAPGNDKAMFGIVRIEEARGAIDLVGTYLQQWSREYPEKTWVALSYGRLLQAIGQMEKAKEVVKRAAVASPNHPELLAFLADTRPAIPKASQPVALPTTVKAERKKPEERVIAQQANGYHQVEAGEVLSIISTKVYGTARHWKAIFDANRNLLETPESVAPGMKLRIPELPGKKKIGPGASGMPEGKERVHVVKRGESLLSISRRAYGSPVHWRMIFEANRKKLRKPNSLHAGIRLKLPALAVAESAVPSDEGPAPVVSDQIAVTSAAPEKEKRRESVLVSPDSVKLPELPREEAPRQVMHQEEPPELPYAFEPGLHFGLLAAPVSETAKLEAIGFSSTLPAKIGYLAGAEIGYQFAGSPVELSGSFEFSRTKFAALSGVSPTEITLERRHASAMGRYKGFLTPGLDLVLGYSWRTRAAAETTPRAVVTNKNAAGLIAGAGYSSSLSPELAILSKVEFFLPHRHEETLSITGYHRSSSMVQAKIGLSRPLGPSSSASLSLSARYERSTYSGTGTRGSTNGAETDWTFALPLEVRF